MHVVLVQPPHRDTFGYAMPPLGALHLGAAARAAGHRVTFVDLAYEVRRGALDPGPGLTARCADHLAALAPDAIGLGAMISSMPAALHLAAELERRLPEVPIVLGGQGPEAVEERVLERHPAVDAVAVGEADVTFVEWLAALESSRPDGTPRAATASGDVGPAPSPRAGSAAALPSAPQAPGDAPPAVLDVAGLVVRHGGRPVRTPPRPLLPSLDELPPPAWDLAPSPRAYTEAAGGDEGLFPIDLGRGCTYACSFCTTPVFWGRRARLLSPSRAVDELDRMASLDGLDCAYVTHDLFTVDRDHVLAFCAEKTARGNTLPWECRTRIDLVDGELLEAMAAAGCRRILYGIESDSPRLLTAMRKGGRLAPREVARPGTSDVGLPAPAPDRGAVAPSEGAGRDAGGRVEQVAGAPTRGRCDPRTMLELASRAGVASIVGVMAGFPGETEDDVEVSLQLLADAALLDKTSLSLHWWNVTPGNGRAAEAGADLRLIPGLTADLVRGFDLPAGQIEPEQARLIAEDGELFSAFRVFTPAWAEPRDLYLLARNAHLVLEALPRTLRALAAARGTTLLDVLLGTLRRAADGEGGAVAALAGDDGDTGWFASPAPALSEDAENAAPHAASDALAGVDSPWDEPLVLRRPAAISLFADEAALSGRPDVATVAAYERALVETETAQLVHFDVDPRPALAAAAARPTACDHGPARGVPPHADDPAPALGAPAPSERTPLHGPVDLAFVRDGDRVRALALSPFLADVAATPDDVVLAARWPGVEASTVRAARDQLADLGLV